MDFHTHTHHGAVSGIPAAPVAVCFLARMDTYALACLLVVLYVLINSKAVERWLTALVEGRVVARYVESRAWWTIMLVAMVYNMCRIVLSAVAGMEFSHFLTKKQPTPVEMTLELVERAIAGVGVASFCSFGVQLDGLIGSTGISPAAELIQRRKTAAQWESASWAERLAAVHRLPNIFWVAGASDFALRTTCACGLLASLLLCMLGGAWSAASLALSGPLAAFLWAVAYACHLSLIAVSGDFLGLQSDSNQCEVAALFSLLALYRSTGVADAATTGAALQTVRWLAVRKMLGCGLCKYYGSPMWRAGTAMDVHYWTQPLPNPLSSVMHHLPPVLHRLACVGTLIIEILLPALGALPLQSARAVACAGFLGINVAINLSGSFGMIGALSVAESLSLLDDELLQPSTWAAPFLAPFHDIGATEIGDVRPALMDSTPMELSVEGSPPGSTGLVVLRLALSLVLCSYVAASLPPVAQAAKESAAWPSARLRIACEWLYHRARRYRVVNYYAKFGSMHAFRWELVLEGSDDGERWLPYGFRYKPWSATIVPPWVLLHLPRLDWRLWFLPLGCRREGALYKPPDWLASLLRGVLQHRPQVLSLLDTARNPFPHSPPAMLRTRLVAFDFAAPQEVAHAQATPPVAQEAIGHWKTVALPEIGKWDTSSLCLHMSQREECLQEWRQ